MSNKLKAHARNLRTKLTYAEKVIWFSLRNRNLCSEKVRRQHPIGSYIVDFVYLEKKLIIELDGGQHQRKKDQDTAREQWLMSEGYKVLRFWNNDVLNNLEGVLETIGKHLV